MDLRGVDAVMLCKRFSIVMMRTVFEVRGVPCIAMEEEHDIKGQLIFSRSCSTPITDMHGKEQVLVI